MKDRPKIFAWLLAIRPKTLPAAAAPVFIGTAMAFGDTGAISIAVFLVTTAAALLLQIGANLSNDYFDYIKGADNQSRKGPLRVTQSGLVSKKAIRLAIAATFLLAAGCGIYLIFAGGVPILVIGILSILSGILYTAGPRPLGYLGLGDIFVLVFFGPVAVAGTYYLQTLQFSYLAVLSGLAPGFLSVAILTANNLRDRVSDEKSGKRTLVVRFGHRFGIAEYFFSMIISAAIPVILFFITGSHVLSILSSAIIIPSVFLLRKVASRPGPEIMIGVLENTGRVLLAYSIIFSIGWMIYW